MSRSGAVKSKKAKKFAPKVKKTIERRRKFQKKVRAREKRANQRIGEPNVPRHEQDEARIHQALATSMNDAVKKKSKTPTEEEEEEALFDAMPAEEEQMELSESEDELGEGEESTLGHLTSAVSRHKKELDQLKTQDPEFYSFLKKNDQNLLDFTELSDDEEEEEEPEEEEIDQDAEKEESEHDEELDVIGTGKELPELTWDLLQKWIVTLAGDRVSKGIFQWSPLASSGSALRLLLLEFRKCCHVGDETQEFATRYQIIKSKVFNEIIVFCFKHLSSLFYFHLGISSQETTEKGEKGEDQGDKKVEIPEQQRARPVLPDRNAKKWKKVSVFVKSFLRAAVHFLGNLPSDASMAMFVLRHMENYVPFLATQQRLCWKILKSLLGVWSRSDHQAVRILAFFLIRKLAIVCPYPFINTTLKKTFRTFVRNVKFVTPTNYHFVTFMSNCVLELFRLDFLCSYQYMFVHLRECAVQIRAAISSRTKENISAVYGWSTIIPLQMWVDLVVQNPNQPEMIEMVYPLTQVILGVYNLMESPQYYPLKLRCLDMLTLLGKHTGTFIPVAGLSVSIFENIISKHANRGNKFKGSIKVSDSKKLEFSTSLKISKAHVETKGYLDTVIIRLCDHLIEYFTSLSYNIGFPDLATLVLIRLRKALKSCREANWSRRAKVVIDKIEQNIQFIENKRRAVNFNPTDVEEVLRFSEELQQKGKSPLEVYNLQRLKMDKSKQMVQEEEQNRKKGMKERKEEEMFDPKRMKKPKEKKKQGKKEEGQIGKREEGKRGKGAKKKFSAEEVEEMEDVVEDFDISSDEEEE